MTDYPELEEAEAVLAEENVRSFKYAQGTKWRRFSKEKLRSALDQAERRGAEIYEKAIRQEGG